MAKRKTKNVRQRQTTISVADATFAPRLEWESVEADFFARELDLYQVNPVENFDDLDKD